MDDNKNKLRVKVKDVFIHENDPNNVYGDNYKKTDVSVRQKTKYNKLKEHVNFSVEDKKYLEQQDEKYYKEFAYYPPVGFIFAYLMTNFSGIKLITRNKQFSFLLIAVPICMFGLKQVEQTYHNNIRLPFIAKYTKEAIKNGFIDYEIEKS